jgi:ferrochelatase
MAFRTEPEFTHGAPGAEAPRTAVLLCNLGTPDEPTAAALRRYLASFCRPPRGRDSKAAVVAAHPARHHPAGAPGQIGAKYASIWTPEGSPLKAWTARQATALGSALARRQATTCWCAMPCATATRPLPAQLDAAQGRGRHTHPDPAGLPAVQRHHHRQRVRRGLHLGGPHSAIPELRFVNRYHDEPGYIDALAHRIEAHWASTASPTSW